MTCWHPPTAQDIGRGALKGAATGIGLGCAFGGLVGVFNLLRGGQVTPLVQHLPALGGAGLGVLIPCLGVAVGALGAWEASGQRVPVTGTLSHAGPDDLLFRSDQLAAPMSLSAYLSACEEAFVEGPLPHGNYLLEWNGSTARGSDKQLDGASRKAASLVNAAWSSLRSQGLHRQAEADYQGIHWVRNGDGSGCLTWKPGDNPDQYRAQLVPGQGVCRLTVSADHGSSPTF